jgi:hypothetical protein
MDVARRCAGRGNANEITAFQLEFCARIGESVDRGRVAVCLLDRARSMLLLLRLYKPGLSCVSASQSFLIYSRSLANLKVCTSVFPPDYSNARMGGGFRLQRALGIGIALSSRFTVLLQ